jgi:hypothetical protein
VVYNTNAYDAVAVLRLLDQIVDVYLPDLKYADDESGYLYSKVSGHWRRKTSTSPGEALMKGSAATSFEPWLNSSNWPMWSGWR